MALFSLKNVDLGFGGPLLLDQVNLQIESGERLGVLGRNGAGKSTLLKLINGDLSPAEGQIARQQGLVTAYLPQEVPSTLNGKVIDIIKGGFITNTTVPQEEWSQQIQIDQVISRMELDPQAQFDILSAGMKRRVLLARGLVNDPDILLLDEPTNHLDIKAIQWLEDFLYRWNGTLVFVTHDRMFLQRISSRIVELDRGRLFDWNCNYQVFLERKQSMLAAEENAFYLFDKKLAQEELWIRQGIEARRTRNEGRVRALQRLREVRQERREQPAKIKMQIQDERKSGRLVVEVNNLCFGFGDQMIIDGFSTVIRRGDKVGIIGANGSGKTTLLKLLLGDLKPLSGSIELGTNLNIAYFDQLRSQLDEDQSILQNVGQGRDVLTINGRSRNIYGYLEDFLFTKDRIHAPIVTLSGGERNRLLLARLFTQPANLLVLDEPTNDLDIDTLEVLEDLLLDYSGTLILVSHDRSFLNNIITTSLVMEGDGQVGEYVGGFDDWQRQKAEKEVDKKTVQIDKIKTNGQGAVFKETRRLTYKEKRELEEQKKELTEMPERIEKLETEQHNLSLEISQPAFYQQSSDAITQAMSRLNELNLQLEESYRRWAELEKLFPSKSS